MKSWASDRRLARDQEVKGGTANAGTANTGTLTAETVYECVVALVKKTADSELDKLMTARRTMVDSYGGTAADQPPLFHYGTMPLSQFAQDRALGRLPPPPSAADQRLFYELFPEARRIGHI